MNMAMELKGNKPFKKSLLMGTKLFFRLPIYIEIEAFRIECLMGEKNGLCSISLYNDRGRRNEGSFADDSKAKIVIKKI